MNLDVPDTIPLSKVQAFLADLGFQLDDLIELTVGIRGVHVEMYARNTLGKHYREQGDVMPARHTIALELDREA